MGNFEIGDTVVVKTPWSSPEFPSDSQVIIGLLDVTECPNFDATKSGASRAQFNVSGMQGLVIYVHAHLRGVQFHSVIDGEERVFVGLLQGSMLEPL